MYRNLSRNLLTFQSINILFLYNSWTKRWLKGPCVSIKVMQLLPFVICFTSVVETNKGQCFRMWFILAYIYCFALKFEPQVYTMMLWDDMIVHWKSELCYWLCNNPHPLKFSGPKEVPIILMVKHGASWRSSCFSSMCACLLDM